MPDESYGESVFPPSTSRFAWGGGCSREALEDMDWRREVSFQRLESRADLLRSLDALRQTLPSRLGQAHLCQRSQRGAATDVRYDVQLKRNHPDDIDSIILNFADGPLRTEVPLLPDDFPKRLSVG